MDYAKKSLCLLSPWSLSKCVSASTSITQQLLASPAPCARPYRVCNCDRTLRKGIMADSLRDLQEKVRSTLLLVGNISIVLDEDGTSVETEEFFETLEEGTVLLVLTKGQTWRPAKTAGYQLALSHKPRRRIDVACVTFDLYKTNPRDFIGCLNVKATLYGTYSLSYDVQCQGAKKIMKLPGMSCWERPATCSSCWTPPRVRTREESCPCVASSLFPTERCCSEREGGSGHRLRLRGPLNGHSVCTASPAQFGHAGKGGRAPEHFSPRLGGRQNLLGLWKIFLLLFFGLTLQFLMPVMCNHQFASRGFSWRRGG